MTKTPAIALIAFAALLTACVPHIERSYGRYTYSPQHVGDNTFIVTQPIYPGGCATPPSQTRLQITTPDGIRFDTTFGASYDLPMAFRQANGAIGIASTAWSGSFDSGSFDLKLVKLGRGERRFYASAVARGEPKGWVYGINRSGQVLEVSNPLSLAPNLEHPTVYLHSSDLAVTDRWTLQTPRKPRVRGKAEYIDGLWHLVTEGRTEAGMMTMAWSRFRPGDPNYEQTVLPNPARLRYGRWHPISGGSMILVFDEKDSLGHTIATLAACGADGKITWRRDFSIPHNCHRYRSQSDCSYDDVRHELADISLLGGDTILVAGTLNDRALVMGFDTTGTLLWEQRLPGPPLSIEAGTDGRFLVSTASRRGLCLMRVPPVSDSG